jgi:hypothetical protein
MPSTCKWTSKEKSIMSHFYRRCTKLSCTTCSETSDKKYCILNIYQFSLRYKRKDRILIHRGNFLISHFLYTVTLQLFVFGGSFVAEWGAEYRLILDEFHLSLGELVKPRSKGKIFHLRGLYRAADKSFARPGRKQATATEDFEFHIYYL